MIASKPRHRDLTRKTAARFERSGPQIPVQKFYISISSFLYPLDTITRIGKRQPEEEPMKPPEAVDEVAAQFVPKDTPDIVAMDLEKAAVEITMATNIPLVLVGHTGTAKTKLVQRMHQDASWPYRAINGRESTEVDNLLGKWRIGDERKMEYHIGVLPFCMKHGIAVGIQECNYVAPEVLVLLHEYVDEGYITLDELSPDDENFIIYPHPNFRLYGTMNPPELYPGARELSPALLRRCIVRSVSPLEAKDEIKVVMDQGGSDQKTAEQMVAVAQAVRQQFDSNQGLFWLSTADLVMWARVSKHLNPLEAAEIAVVGKAPENEVPFVRGRVRLSFEPNKVPESASAL